MSLTIKEKVENISTYNLERCVSERSLKGKGKIIVSKKSFD